jgi:hypothetical protein
MKPNGRTAAPSDKASGFLLSVLSPVWRATLCGDIGGEARRELALDGGEGELFRKLVALGCGAAVTVEGGVEGLMALGLMAGRYQVDAVQVAVEEAVVRLLTVESCGKLLTRSSGSGLVRVAKASWELALREFDDFARTEGFMEVGEEVLGSLLEDDALNTGGEEPVFEGVVRWMKGGEGGRVRGSGLLGKVRFPLMAREYLAGLLNEGCVEVAGLGELVGEAMSLQRVGRGDWGGQELRHLDGRTVVDRRRGVRWEEYAGGGERRLAAGELVFSLAADGEYVCGGLHYGSIKVWSRSTLELERTLPGHGNMVFALLFVRGLLVSGSTDSAIRVWDVAAGRCEGVLEGHTLWVTSLALCGDRLLSGGYDQTVRVWGTEGGPSSWRCERTLDGFDSDIVQVAAWGDRVAIGCGDGIQVRSSGTWAVERSLHSPALVCLAVSGRRLVSSCRDGTVRAWSAETWECVQTVQVHPAESDQWIAH